jgi:hypothetical protein
MAQMHGQRREKGGEVFDPKLERKKKGHFNGALQIFQFWER